MKTLTLLAALAALAGCGAPAQRLSDSESCRMDGFAPGTGLYLQCLGQRQQYRAQALGALSAGMAETNRAATAPLMAVYSSPAWHPANRSFTCQHYGSYSTCN